MCDREIGETMCQALKGFSRSGVRYVSIQVRIAVHYAVAETEKGRRVALIDSDVQESSTRWLKDLADGVAVFRLPTPD
jgi:hypothetical protein